MSRTGGDERVGREWFADARFGIFIHFGLYALHGGNENDYGRGVLAKADYEALRLRFNPRKFDADAWVRSFRDAGARYAVLTAKHGEGFCLWDTDQTAYKITNTPFGRDLVAEYTAACRRHRVRVGLYFSIADWHYAEPGEGTSEGRTYPGYVEAQLRELLTRYGRVDEIWFDGGDARLTPAFMRRIVRLIHTLQPSCVVTDRGITMGHDVTRAGDFTTPERFIPASVGARHRKLECCDAMGRKSWGFHRDETFWSSPELIARLCRVAALGGNYLLNVEPMPDGRIRPECVARLRDIGAWVRRNGRAVFEAGVCPAVALDAATRPPAPLGVTTRAGRRLYVHLFAWPAGEDVLLPGVTGEVTDIAVVGGRKVAGLRCRVEAGAVNIHGLPASAPGALPIVLQLDFRKEPAVVRTATATRTVAPLPGGTLVLAPEAAQIRARDGIPFHQLKVHAAGTTAIGMIFRHGAELVWRVDAAAAGRYEVWAHLGAMSSQAGSGYTVSAGRSVLAAKTEDTGHYDTPRWFRVGELRLKQGIQSVTWRLVDMPAGHSADIHGFVLKRAPHARP